MPIYEYLCKSCDDQFEALMGVHDEKPCCPKCGSDEVERVLSSFCSKGPTRSGSSSGGPPAPST